MSDHRRKHGSEAHHRSLPSRAHRSRQSRQQDRRVPRGFIDADVIREETGENTEYNVSHGYLYDYQGAARNNPTYTQSTFNMTATPTIASSLTRTEAGYGNTSSTAPFYAYTGFPTPPPAGSQGGGDTEVPAYEPTSTNSDHARLPNGSSNYYSGSERLASHPTVTTSIDTWSGSYPNHPPSRVGYSSAAFTSDDAGLYTQSPSYTQAGETSFTNHDTSTTPLPSDAGTTYVENNVLGRDDVSEQEQGPYVHQGYRRGSGGSMQNNYGSPGDLIEPTIGGDPVQQHGGEQEQAHLNNGDFQQEVITEYMNSPSPWSPMNLDNRGYGTNSSSAQGGFAGFPLEQ
ncbi:hypothetical protein F5Y06DRAFT_302510 [Hypoxylon sp. FL0890]|nr:hypothetical protein F5Y06DRAFT_302510 [Hypoxylon sp. FL0890]